MVGSGVGACQPGLANCEGGEWAFLFPGVEPTEEACNLEDDDCDGSVDEGLCAPGQQCDLDGACFDSDGDYCAPCQRRGHCNAVGDEPWCYENEVGEQFCGSECSRDEQCPADWRCVPVEARGVNGVCVPFDETCQDRCEGVQCPDGQACDALTGACDLPRCFRNDQCAADQYCSMRNGRCRVGGTGNLGHGGDCRGDRGNAWCGPGHVCLYGLCRRLCDGQADCEDLDFVTCQVIGDYRACDDPF